MDPVTARVFGRAVQLACLHGRAAGEGEDATGLDAVRRDAAAALAEALVAVLAGPLAVTHQSPALATTTATATEGGPADAAGPAVTPAQLRLRVHLALAAREQGVLPLVAWALREAGARASPPPPRLLASGIDLVALGHSLTAADAQDLGLRLGQVALMLRAQQALTQAGIDNLAYKGAVLGALAYPRWDLRPAGSDVDLLVCARDLEPACACLARLGFAVVKPLPRRSRAFAMAMVGEVMLSDGQGGIIDLHWTLHPPYYSYGPSTPAVIGAGRWLMVASGAQPVRTLDAAETVLLVALHGAKEGWSQWRWLADLALVLHRTPHADLRAALARARARGCETLLLTGICLVGELAHSLPDLPEFRDLRERHPRAGALARDWRAAAEGRPLAVHRELARGADRSRDCLRGLTAQLRPWPIDWQELDLPAAFSWAYWLYRPWRLARRTLRAALQRTAPTTPPAPSPIPGPGHATTPGISDRPAPPGTPTPHN